VPHGRDLSGRHHGRRHVLQRAEQCDPDHPDATTADGMSYGNGKKRGAAAVMNRQLVVRARELLSKQPSRGTRNSSSSTAAMSTPGCFSSAETI